MREYLNKRLLFVIPTLLGITLVVFFVMHLIPGDPADVLLGQDYNQEVAQQLRTEWGLDEPILLQYVKWLGHILQGDWGRSFFSRKPVLAEVLEKLPISLQLIAFAMCFALLIAVPAGVIAAAKAHGKWDYGAMTFALFGVSIPEFFLGILLFLTFGLTLGWFPVQGYVAPHESLLENLRHMILPAIALGAGRAAILTRLVRGSMLEVIRQEYVTTARSKGLREVMVIAKHALRNALIPAVTVMGLQVGFMVGGAIIIEKLFAIPGLGSYGIDAITNRDYTQVQGFILVSASIFVVANLCVDFIYCFLDPRIRYGSAEA
jgi:peptide/nickel transport system permease protein